MNASASPNDASAEPMAEELEGVYLPCARGTKECRVPGWNSETLPPVALGESDNRALRLDGHVDVDLDCREARIAASRFLPETARQHGRPSVGVTHHWYSAESAHAEKFVDVVGHEGDNEERPPAVLMEIRAGKDQYTLVPPSRVPIAKRDSTFETLTWFKGGAPLKLAFDHLRAAVLYCAITALVARHYAPDGVRWQFYEALAGFFLGLTSTPFE